MKNLFKSCKIIALCAAVIVFSLISCASMSIGEHPAVGTWTAYLPDTTVLVTYIINADGSYKVTLYNAEVSEDYIEVWETGTWEKGSSGLYSSEIINATMITFIMSDGGKYYAKYAFDKMTFEDKNNKMTFTKQETK